jgi:hypothetical protein
LARVRATVFEDGIAVGRRVPRVRALPLLPQLADHVLFGAVAGYVLGRRRHRTVVRP